MNSPRSTIHGAPTTPAGADRPRHLHYLDNLRVAMILMVVVHHVSQAYGPQDWWYFQGDQHSRSLETLSAVGGAFRMPLLFLVAGYFVAQSFDRSGAWPLARSRLKRLGLPFLVSTVTMIPVLTYVYYVQYRGYPPISFPRYYLDVFLGFGEKPDGWSGPIWPDLQFGHLWFIQNLLVLSLVYSLVRWLIVTIRDKRDARKPHRPPWTPNHLSQVGLTVAIALAAFTIRIAYPLDTWVPFLEFIQVEPARVAHYIAFFAIGALASRNDWLSRIPASMGYTSLCVGLGMTALVFVTGTNTDYFDPGGATWSSLLWTATESIMGVELCVGLLILFRECFNGSTKLTRVMAGMSYTMYIIHVPIVVGLQFAFAPAFLATLSKFSAVSLLAIACTAAAAYCLLKVPGVRALL